LWWVDPGWRPDAHQAALSPLSSDEKRRENIMKGLWVEIRSGRDHSPITVTGKTD